MGVSRIFRADTPYPSSVVSDLDYAQSADVLYVTHLDYPIQRVTRFSHTDWVFSDAQFGATLPAPDTPTVTASSPNTVGYMPVIHEYMATAIGGTPEQESQPSPIGTAGNDLTLNGNTNTIVIPLWTHPDPVSRFIIYKRAAGTFGYIGSTDTRTFVDGSPQLEPVLSDSPPIGADPFSRPGMYPSSVTFHNQRLIFARTRELPNAVWGSHPADFQNMDVSRPTKPDDALSFALVAEKVNSVNQMVSMQDLILLTSNGVFSVSGGQSGDPLTPSDIVPRRGNSRGGSRLNPIVLDESIFYTPSKGAAVRTLGYKFDIDGYQSNNVAIFSPHFFKDRVIVDWAYVEEPYSAIFVVLDDGGLLCFTWEAEQQVWGWTKLETAGLVKAVASITEGGFDRLYVLVEREINGIRRKFHERLALPHVDDVTTACHLDCSVTQVYSPPRNVIGGLSHLEGETVSAYYDGFVANDLVVVRGEVTLPNGYEASIASVGLPYTGEIETLPLVLNTQGGSLHINRQNVARMVIRALDTRGLLAGITDTELERIVEHNDGSVDFADTAQRDYDVTPPGTWRPSTTLTIRQVEPVPAHITGIFVEPKVSNK